MISIIVPVYNVEKYIKRCLESILAQDYFDYEVIIVNDGSDDDSENICKEFINEKYNFYYYKKTNGGLGDARNFGLEHAKGEYICFIDSDDYIRNDYLSKLYNKAKEEDSDIVVCDYYLAYEDKEIIESGKANINEDIKKDYLISAPNAWNKLYKRELFIKNNIRYPKDLYYEDLATTPLLLLNANKISYVNEALYYYVQRSGSIMNQEKYNIKNNDIFEVLNIINSYYKNHGKYELYKDEFEYIASSRLLHDYSLRVYKYPEGKKGINDVANYMCVNYPNFKENKYYNNNSLKYKIICDLIYNENIGLLKLILR